MTPAARSGDASGLFEAVVTAVNARQPTTLVLGSARSMAGGDINHAALLDCGSDRIFVKYHHQPPVGMFEAEAEALHEIAATGTIRVPRPLAWGQHGDTGFLALEWLDLGRADPSCHAALGQSLAALHRYPQTHFGWHRDNTIGRTPQPNPRTGDWVSFYAEQRLGYQVERLARTRGTDLSALIAPLIAHLDHFFDDGAPAPALLHGDLWGGNWSALSDGTPVVYDPASYYGDPEADLAMTRLFGGFGAEFYDAYHDVLPARPGARRRRDLYQLYHVLNHANLFGGGYVEQSRSLIERLRNALP